MPPQSCRSVCLFSSLLILLLVKDSIQSPQTKSGRRVPSRSRNSNPLLSRTNEPAQPANGAQGEQLQADLAPLIRWAEEEEEEEEEVPKPSMSTSTSSECTLQRKRKLIWWSGSLDDRPRRKGKASKDAELESQPQPQPHPLRTDVWKMTVRWRQYPHPQDGRRNKKKAAKKDMLLEFADNGYVRLCPQPGTDSDKLDLDTDIDVDKPTATTSSTPIGTWKLDPSGLSWHLPLNDREHYFFADIHMNPFGKCPKMTRGIVIRDNDKGKGQSWFRPVVATFVGSGVGTDTADFSYKHRNFGLYQADKTADSLER
jgi:hypothetical protein